MGSLKKRSPAPRANAEDRADHSNPHEINNSMLGQEIEPECLRKLAHRLHACGPRVLFEFLADLARGRDFAETLADFARLDPALYAAIAALVIDGGRA